MPENPAIKERLLHLRKADYHLRLITRSSINHTEADILESVLKLLWTVYRNIEHGK